MIVELKKTRKIWIILDSNAWFVPLQFKIDVIEELKALTTKNFELVLLSPIKHELEKLANGKSPQMRKKAICALKMTEKCRVVEIDNIENLYPDDAIVKVAGEWRCPVFTNDKKLRKRLRDINVPVIYVRQKSHLEIDGRL